MYTAVFIGIMTADIIKRLLIARTSGDDIAFREAIQEYISEERRRRHMVVAQELERLLERGDGTTIRLSQQLSVLGAYNGDIPKDKERGLALLQIIEPERTLDTVILDGVTQQSVTRIIEENRRSDLIRSHGLQPISKILLCGPPGCGKTVTAEAIAKELYLPLVLVRFDAIISSYLGETAANLRKVFDFARGRRVVLFFDEFDAIGKKRTDSEEHGELKRVVNAFLQMIDSFAGETLVIAATNHQVLLDSALWRRFDDIVAFQKPNSTAIRELLVRNLRQFGCAPAMNMRRMVEVLKGMSHADVEAIARVAIKTSILRDDAKVTATGFAAAVSHHRARLRLTRGHA
jgi:SpoVK/Ycf46/Vps4 family AAA+-type ATPase